MLVDSGATHNFISKIVTEMGMQVGPTPNYLFSVGDGRKIRSSGKCRELELNMQGLKVKQTFYLFPLANVNVVLGISWLQSLGEVRVNWGRLYMKVREGQIWKCLTRDPTLTRSNPPSGL